MFAVKIHDIDCFGWIVSCFKVEYLITIAEMSHTTLLEPLAFNIIPQLELNILVGGGIVKVYALRALFLSPGYFERHHEYDGNTCRHFLQKRLHILKINYKFN